jgi:hypothetical protein
MERTREPFAKRFAKLDKNRFNKEHICASCDAGWNVALDDLHRYYQSDQRGEIDYLYWICPDCGSKEPIPEDVIPRGVKKYLFLDHSIKRRF